MSNPVNLTLSLTSDRDFKTEVTVIDPPTNSPITLPFEIDTGNPDALAVPRSYGSVLNDFQGVVRRVGAGSGSSDCYRVNIVDVGGCTVSYQTLAIATLNPQNFSFGLIGMDLLRELYVEIHGNPNNKQMDMDLSNIT